jgi:hypothetical protein
MLLKIMPIIFSIYINFMTLSNRLNNIKLPHPPTLQTVHSHCILDSFYPLNSLSSSTFTECTRYFCYLILWWMSNVPINWSIFTDILCTIRMLHNTNSTSWRKNPWRTKLLARPHFKTVAIFCSHWPWYLKHSCNIKSFCSHTTGCLWKFQYQKQRHGKNWNNK